MSAAAYDAIFKQAGIQIKPGKQSALRAAFELKKTSPCIQRTKFRKESVLPNTAPESSVALKDNLYFDSAWWKRDLELFFETPRKSIVKLTDDIANDLENGSLSVKNLLQILWNAYTKYLDLCRSRRYSSQKSEFDQFVFAFLVPDSITDASAKEIQQARILSVFSEMKRHGHYPDATTFTYMIRAFGNNLRFLGKIHNHIVARILEEKTSGIPFSPIVNELAMRSLLIGYEKSVSPAKFDYIERLWYDVREVNVSMTHQLGVGFIHAFQSQIPDPKGLAGVMRVHKVLEQRRPAHPWPRHVADALMEAYSYTQSHRTIKKLFETQEATFPLVTENYKACMKVQKETNYSAESILHFGDLMMKNNIAKDDDVFRMILDACIDVRDRGLIRTKCHSQFYLYTTICKEQAQIMPKNGNLIAPFKPLFPSATPFTFFRIVAAFSKLGDLRGALRALDQWYETRVWIQDISQRRHDFYAKTASSTIGLKEHKIYTPPPAMFALAALARCQGVCFSMDKEYFRTHVFAPPCIQLEWKKRLAVRRKELLERIEEARIELMEAKKRNKKASRIMHLENSIKSLECHLEGGVKLNEGDLGEDGPFGPVYSSFSRGFLQKAGHLAKKGQNTSMNNENELSIDVEDSEWDTSVNARIVDKNVLDAYENGGFEELAILLRDFLCEIKEIERKCVQEYLDQEDDDEKL